MNYKNIILQNEFSFEYSFDEMNTPFVTEYSKMFEHLNLSTIQRYSYRVDTKTDIPLMYQLEPNNKKDDKVAIELYCKLCRYYPEFYQSKVSQLANKGYYEYKVFAAFDLMFAGKSYIPINRRNSKNAPIKTPTCSKGLKMQYHSSWYEEEQKRFRVKFIYPAKNVTYEHKKAKYGCTKYFQAKKPSPEEVQQNSKTFKQTYPLRQSVERVDAYLQNFG